MLSPALFSVLALLGMPVPGPTTLTAQEGQAATLRVELGTKDLLLNREAPNLLVLRTPWGEAQAQPSGAAHRDPAHAGYFGQVRPMTLKVRVPTQVAPGRYAAQLTADLFVCDTGEQLCTRRTLGLPVQIQVGNVARPGKLTPPGKLTLRDEHLRPVRLRRGLTPS